MQLVAGLRATIETHTKLLEITEKQLEKRDALEDRLPALRGPRAPADGRSR
jgi:hypothetical protein